MPFRQSILFVLPLSFVLGSCSSRLPYEGKTREQLEAMLKDDDPKVQAQGAYGLSMDPEMARDAVPALIEALLSPHALVREKAARALASAGPGAVAAVPALTEALHDSEWTVQRQAALALGEVGPQAVAAVPALKALEQSSQRVLRDAALQALEKIAPE
jgi:HEAT repeat protein